VEPGDPVAAETADICKLSANYDLSVGLQRERLQRRLEGGVIRNRGGIKARIHRTIRVQSRDVIARDPVDGRECSAKQNPSVGLDRDGNRQIAGLWIK